MDNKIDKIADDVTKIKVSIAKIEATMEKNTDSLIIHMKRSDLLEKKLEPVERHVAITNALGRMILIVLTVSGTILGILQYFKK